MAVYKFSWGEYYPFYTNDESLGHPIELTEEEFKCYKASLEEFYKWQNFINDKYPQEKRYG